MSTTIDAQSIPVHAIIAHLVGLDALGTKRLLQDYPQLNREIIGQVAEYAIEVLGG